MSTKTILCLMLNKGICLFCLFVYIFQLNRDGSSWVEPVLSQDKCVLLKDHNAVKPVRLEPQASRSRVNNSTTEPLISLKVLNICICMAINSIINLLS